MNKGNEGYLVMVRDVETIVLSLDQVLIAKEFPNVSPKELPRMPPNREIEFYIDLALNVQPVSIPPYRMASTELQELKVQLQDMLDKGFIRPSTSPWGCSNTLREEKRWDNAVIYALSSVKPIDCS